MSIKVSIFIWLFSSVFCFAQTDSTKIPFVAYWSKGDHYDYLITKINKESSGEVLQKEDSTSYFATFTVIDSTENSYKINWKYKTSFESLPIQFGELLNNNSVILDFVYTTNELGEFIGVENWKEIADYMKSILNEEISKVTLNNPYIDIEKFNAAMAPFLNIFTSKEGIESVVLRELNYFHFPFGVELDPKIVFEYEDELPNFFEGEEPLKGLSQIQFDSVDGENTFCIFTHKLSIRPDSAKKFLNKIMDVMNLNTKEVIEELNSGNLVFSENNYFEYFYNPGVPYFIEANRLIELDAGSMQNKKEEIIRIELILDED